jgi:signal transduction histidine kinase
MAMSLWQREHGGSELRLSRSLAFLHFGGIVALVLVVLVSVLWVSAQHNSLAKDSSQRLVESGFESLLLKIRTVVRDYSVWDEAYAAVDKFDPEWLYRNIGTGVTVMGTLDLIVIFDPMNGREVGWIESSPEQGEANLLSRDVVETVNGLINDARGTETVIGSAFIMIEGEPWMIAAAHVQPFEGVPPGRVNETLPVQVHGLRVSEEILNQVGSSLLIDDLHVSLTEPENLASIPLRSVEGLPIAYVVWTPPRPGASILGQIALPLGLALAVVAAIAVVSSRFAVRSAARLEQALIDAQAADRMKTEFLSNVSHELRTPMNGIVGVAQLLQMTELDEEQRELVGVLASSADTQMSLISDLLDLTRMESGNRQLQIARFEPAQVLRDTVEMVRPIARDKNLALELELAPLDGLAVLGDARAFRQIMTNLVGNAAKFTDRGSILVRGEVTRTGDAAELVLKVRDTGRGIPPEHQRRIFDRFYQVDGSQTRDAGGTGLGLAISQSLGHMMGGHIEVQSTPGVGSTFTFRVKLPVASADAALQNAA